MFKNFLKLTFRNLLKNKTFVFINLAGLGLSLACCIVAYLNYEFGTSFDKNHEHLDKIYKVQSRLTVNGRQRDTGLSSIALADAFQGKSSSVSRQSRYALSGLSYLKNNRVISRQTAFVDPDYFKMFTFPVKYGEVESLQQRGNIVLTEEFSLALFGWDVDPVGQTVQINHQGKQVSYTVTGVLEKLPTNSSMRFGAIMSIEHYYDLVGTKSGDWKRFIHGTFVQINRTEDLESFKKIIQDFIPLQHNARKDLAFASFYLEPLREAAFSGREKSNYWLYTTPHPAAIHVPAIMAVLMLLIACFNFTNTSIAISSKRMKEIGVKKVMGSSKRNLILQFITENLVLCFMALLVGILIATWLVPAYSAMWDGINLDLFVSGNGGLLLFIVALLFFTAIIAGIYPAFYISRFEPVRILKGDSRVGKTNWLSYSLLTAQYTLTVVTLISCFAFVKNAMYQNSLDLGFKKEAILFASIGNGSEGKRLRDHMLQDPAVKDAVLTKQHVGEWVYSRTVGYADKELQAEVLDIGLNYAELMDLKLVEGRFFDKNNEEADQQNSVIVNQQLMEELQWTEGLGKRITVADTLRYNVVGVVRNFYNDGFWAPIEPMIIKLTPEEKANYLVLSVKTGESPRILEKLETSYNEIAPDKPFQGDYQDLVIREAQEVNKNIVIIFSFLGLLAGLLSAIGLFTLVSLNVIRRIKEIGMRKVLGASVPHIVTLMNKVFFIVLLIATVLGSLGAVYASNALMGSIFTYYKMVDPFTVVIPVLFVILLSLSISSLRILRTVRQNPVKALRYE